MAIAIYDKGKNRRLFEVTVAQRDQLIDALEEEAADDHDYYIDAAVCEFLDGKVDATVIARLRDALGIKAPVAPDAVEAAGEDEVPPEMGDVDDGIEIEWRDE